MLSAQSVIACAGMSIYAAVFLIPLGVLTYTCVGGLKVGDPSLSCLILKRSYHFTIHLAAGLCYVGGNFCPNKICLSSRMQDVL